ncbi:ribosome silencing factor [Alicyclobacillus macrosporangiidus]|jgi:ribosome-associated protein|uniref:Ribosomal silencing factor RsfS n=1 Tax=Alicyclobacillus macrosporangiidus TaxID=392015 RepID=A0A1I7K999_9BACL|nr:ribosome silencing factor [Alicyclobacillus macrosporangiidus]SFU93988.1 ribosome-associated protein [Alicyclobacillus macrosporangiidus]
MTHSVDHIALEAASAAADKKAKDIVVLDIHDLTPVADYFVICSANSGTQVEAVARAVTDKMAQLGVPCRGTEGMDEARWVLLDFGDVVVHVFRPEEREFYHLERLWGDARQVPFEMAQ